MDTLSQLSMQKFIDKYLKGTVGLSVCDVGSYDVNGTFRPLFEEHKYIGLDITKGPNVDVVSEDPYRYPFDDETFDVVISGSTIEHVEDMFKWIVELKRIIKTGGLICILGPAVFRMQHQHPVDCWRIYPDGMKFLLGNVAGFQVLEAKRVGTGNTIWCMGVGRCDR